MEGNLLEVIPSLLVDNVINYGNVYPTRIEYTLTGPTFGKVFFFFLYKKKLIANER